MKIIIGVAVMALSISIYAAQEISPAVETEKSGLPETTVAQRAMLANWAIQIVATANFSTVRHPETLNMSPVAIHESYRRTLTRPHLIVKYDRPMVVPTINGDVQLVEIILGLDARFVRSLFTIDPEGRVVAYGKFGGMIPQELQRDPTTAPATQPVSNQTRNDLSWTHFRHAYRGMAPDELYVQVGYPSRDIGSGNHILVYQMVGGEDMYVGTDGQRVLYVRRGSIDGVDMLTQE